MAARILIPRLFLALFFLALSAFAFIESRYLASTAFALGGKSGTVALWMWVFRALAIALSLFALVLLTGFFRK
jgi:hypothetical protein